MSIGVVFKGNLMVPHVHECTDNTLSFTVSLRAIDAGKLLADTVLPANCNERMIGGSCKFGAIVGVSTIDPIRALGDDRADEKQAALCWVLSGKIPATAP